MESLQRYSRKVREGSLSSTMMDLQPSSLTQTTNLAECAVCHQVLSERYESCVQIGKRSYIFVDTEKHWKSVFLQPIPKGRVHYGGVSCYSCRAFFRWEKKIFQTRKYLENLWGVQIVMIMSKAESPKLDFIMQQPISAWDVLFLLASKSKL